jgi:hypothetical protein
LPLKGFRSSISLMRSAGHTRSPRVRRVTFHPSPPHIHRSVPDTIGLRTPTLPRPRSTASHAVRVPRVGCLPPAAFRSHLAVDTLAVRRGVPGIKVSKGLAPSSHFPVGFRLPVASAVLALRAMPGARHGRDAGYPALPVQTRTGSFPASGSSVPLASAQSKTIVSSCPVCYCPQEGWRILIRSDLAGMSCLSGLRASVETFPVWGAFRTAAYKARYDDPSAYGGLSL